MPAIERGLSLRGIGGEELQEEVVRLDALTFGGFKEAAQHALVFQPRGRKGVGS